MPEPPIRRVPYFPGVPPEEIPLWALQRVFDDMRARLAVEARRRRLKGVRAPRTAADFTGSDGRRLWDHDVDWFLVELEPALELCVSVLRDDNRLRCFCRAALRRRRCAHVGVVQEREAEAHLTIHPASDEPPLRAIVRVSRVVAETAEEAAADARSAHEAAFHSGVPAKSQDVPSPAAAPSGAETLAAIGNARWYVQDTAREYVATRLEEHVLNYHGKAELANDGYALLEQVRMDANLRAQLRQVLTDSQTVGHG